MWMKLSAECFLLVAQRRCQSLSGIIRKASSVWALEVLCLRAKRDDGLGWPEMYNGEISQIDVLRFLIKKAPGRTAVQLAIAIYGEKSARQRIMTNLDTLVVIGDAVRRGEGVRQSPYRYYPRSLDHERA
jgi:hypothetical protein